MSQPQPNKARWWDITSLNPNLLKPLLILVGVGVLLMTAPGLFGLSTGSGRKPAGATEVMAPAGVEPSEIARLEQQKNAELKAILSKIQGAGAVEVSVTLSSGTASVPVINTNKTSTKTTEKAGDGSVRDTYTTTEQDTNVTVQEGNGNGLAVAKQTRPEVAGVLVVAEGATNPGVKLRLTRAVADYLGVPAFMVHVEPAERGK